MGVCAAVFNPQRHTSASLSPALADARLSLGKQVENAFVVAHEDHHGHGDSGEGVRYRFCPRRGSPTTRNTDIPLKCRSARHCTPIGREGAPPGRGRYALTDCLTPSALTGALFRGPQRWKDVPRDPSWP